MQVGLVSRTVCVLPVCLFVCLFVLPVPQGYAAGLVVGLMVGPVLLPCARLVLILAGGQDALLILNSQKQGGSDLISPDLINGRSLYRCCYNVRKKFQITQSAPVKHHKTVQLHNRSVCSSHG